MALWTRWGGLYAGLICSWLELCIVSALSLEPIYWNTHNKKFEDEAGYIIYPQIGDRLDLICPRSVPLGPYSTEEYEYYKLYLVQTLEQVEQCEVLRTPNLLLTCDRPEHDMRFTIKFQEYSPNLWGHEFKTNHDYYIITTSDGTKEGLENIKGGACLSKGMKVTLKVGQNPKGGSNPQKSIPETPLEKDRGTSTSGPILDPNKEKAAADVTPLMKAGRNQAWSLLQAGALVYQGNFGPVS